MSNLYYLKSPLTAGSEGAHGEDDSTPSGMSSRIRKWFADVDWVGVGIVAVIGVLITAVVLMGMRFGSTLLQGLWENLQQLALAIIPGKQKGEEALV